MTSQHVPESPTNVSWRVVSSSSLVVRWDAPWFAGSSPVTGYDIELVDATGASTVHHSTGDKTSYEVRDLTPEATYRVAVAARNAQGVSDPATGGSVSMDFSATAHAKDDVEGAARRAMGVLRGTFAARRPTGRAAAAAKRDYREATQQPGDSFEALRSFRRDEDAGWVPPTSGAEG